MKHRIIVYSLRGMEFVMQSMVFAVTLMMLVICFFGQSQTGGAVCLALMGAVAAVLYITRSRVRSIPLIVVIYAAVIAFLAAAGRTEEQKVAFVVAGLVQAVYSVVLSLNDGGHFKERMPVGMTGIFIAGSIAGAATRSADVESWSFALGIVFIVIQIIYSNLSSLNEVYMLNENTRNFPAGQMLYANIFIMIIVLVMCAGAMALSNNRYIFKMLEGVTQLLLAVVRAIVQLLQRLQTGNTQEDVGTNTAAEQETGSGILPEGAEGPWTDILNGIAVAIGVLVIVGAAIALVVGAVNILRRMQKAHTQDGDIKEFVEPETPGMRHKRRRLLSTEKDDDVSMNLKARRAYKSAVEKRSGYIKKPVGSSWTPEDISERILNDDTGKTAGIYNKARYSRHEVDKEEIDFLKSMRKIKKQEIDGEKSPN